MAHEHKYIEYIESKYVLHRYIPAAITACNLLNAFESHDNEEKPN